LNEFFAATEHGWRHARCDAEIARYHGNKEAKSVAGKASAAKRARQAQHRKLGVGAEAVQHPLNVDATNQEPEASKNPFQRRALAEPDSTPRR
jgi:uncharacterized protein YdaU (DUF1376 family)